MDRILKLRPRLSLVKTCSPLPHPLPFQIPPYVIKGGGGGEFPPPGLPSRNLLLKKTKQETLLWVHLFLQPYFFSLHLLLGLFQAVFPLLAIPSLRFNFPFSFLLSFLPFSFRTLLPIFSNLFWNCVKGERAQLRWSSGNLSTKIKSTFVSVLSGGFPRCLANRQPLDDVDEINCIHLYSVLELIMELFP